MVGGRFCCGSGREEGGGRREESGSRNGWLGVVMGMVREEGGGRSPIWCLGAGDGGGMWREEGEWGVWWL
jgi:hypothetical protein